MKTYRSKIDLWLMALVFIPLVFPVVNGILEKDWSMLITFTIINALIIYLFSETKYIINGSKLNVRAGILVNTNIKIDEIKSVTKTYNPLSAPALSINRLEIKYGSNYDYALISPKDRAGFVQDLLKINPNIIIKL